MASFSYPPTAGRVVNRRIVSATRQPGGRISVIDNVGDDHQCFVPVFFEGVNGVGGGWIVPSENRRSNRAPAGQTNSDSGANTFNASLPSVTSDPIS